MVTVPDGLRGLSIIERDQKAASHHHIQWPCSASDAAKLYFNRGQRPILSVPTLMLLRPATLFWDPSDRRTNSSRPYRVTTDKTTAITTANMARLANSEGPAAPHGISAARTPRSTIYVTRDTVDLFINDTRSSVCSAPEAELAHTSSSALSLWHRQSPTLP